MSMLFLDMLFVKARALQRDRSVVAAQSSGDCLSLHRQP